MIKLIIKLIINLIIKMTSYAESASESIKNLLENQTIHPEHQITYQKLFSHVWQRIQISDSKETLMEILDEEINQNLKQASERALDPRFLSTLNVVH